MQWWSKQGVVHKTLCDGPIEENIVFPLLREGKTKFYISCPCCAFWRGAVFGGVATVAALAAIAAGWWLVSMLLHV